MMQQDQIRQTFSIGGMAPAYGPIDENELSRPDGLIVLFPKREPRREWTLEEQRNGAALNLQFQMVEFFREERGLAKPVKRSLRLDTPEQRGDFEGFSGKWKRVLNKRCTQECADKCLLSWDKAICPVSCRITALIETTKTNCAELAWMRGIDKITWVKNRPAVPQ